MKKRNKTTPKVRQVASEKIYPPPRNLPPDRALRATPKADALAPFGRFVIDGEIVLRYGGKYGDHGTWSVIERNTGSLIREIEDARVLFRVARDAGKNYDDGILRDGLLGMLCKDTWIAPFIQPEMPFSKKPAADVATLIWQKHFPNYSFESIRRRLRYPRSKS